jgi:hypothetical protein
VACTDGPFDVDLWLNPRTGRLTWIVLENEEEAAKLEEAHEFHVTHEFLVCDLNSAAHNCVSTGFRDHKACLNERKWMVFKLATGLIVGPCQEIK